MNRQIILYGVIFLLFNLHFTASAQKVISLTWNEVVGISQKHNLDIQIQRQDFKHQNLNKWKSLSDFLPKINYQFQATNNIERPVFVIPNFGEVRFGTNYSFTQVFQLQYPLFTGGARWANWRIQENLKQSLEAQLQNKEENVVLQALEAYFNIILSDALIKVNKRSYDAALANFEQVEKFYEAGAASQLDYLRAKSRLSSTKPDLTSAENSKVMAQENLKFILDINPEDSLLVLDSLKQMDFLKEFNSKSVPELQKLALKQRADLESARHQKDAAGKQKWISTSQFLPSVVLNANVQHQAQLNDKNVSREDYVRSKAATISLQFPLFQGAKRVLDYQQAQINNKKAQLQVKKLVRSIQLEVENNFNQLIESKINLESLRQATGEAREALRLANLTYEEGISTQLDVLNAQLQLTNSEVQYQRGVYNYNISQLRLLKAIGKLNSIWNKD